MLKDVLRDELKFFAPPIFVTSGILSDGLKEFNDMLSQNAKWANEGRLVAKIAVLDITEKLWQGQKSSKLFLDVCHKLNTMPQGYVIANKSEIEKKKEEFSLIINTAEDEIGELFGIPVLNVTEPFDLEKIEEIIPVKNRYYGEGTPHYMRRRLKNGEALLVANIEDGKTVTGYVTYEGEKYEITLVPGEIAYFSPDEKCYNKAEKENGEALPEEMQVSWEQENVVPLIAWKNEKKETVLTSGEDKKVFAEINTYNGVFAEKLYVAAKDMEVIEKIEGVKQDEPVRCKVFDDEYVCFSLLKNDVQKIVIYKKSALGENNRIFITGDFDVELTEKEPYYIKFLEQYNLEGYIPKECEIVIKPRRKTLNTKRSVALQGHPFYLGSFSYIKELEFPEKKRNYVLSLNETTNSVTVYVNGEKVGTGVCNPFKFSFSAGGKTELKIRVTGTAANFLECWQTPLGMLDGGFIKEF